MDRFAGFLVVRKPEHAIGVFHEPNQRIGGLIYRGIDRLPWEDMGLSYFGGSLPASLLPIWQELEQSGRELFGRKLLKRYTDAACVLEHWKDQNEILAVRSSHIDASPISESGLTYLGMDCIARGEWSVLLSGPYARPEHFPDTIKRLNVNGLLESENDCAALFDRYVELSARDIVEPLSNDARPIHVEVFSVAAAE